MAKFARKGTYGLGKHFEEPIKGRASIVEPEVPTVVIDQCHPRIERSAWVIFDACFKGADGARAGKTKGGDRSGSMLWYWNDRATLGRRLYRKRCRLGILGVVGGVVNGVVGGGCGRSRSAIVCGGWGFVAAGQLRRVVLFAVIVHIRCRVFVVFRIGVSHEEATSSFWFLSRRRRGHRRRWICWICWLCRFCRFCRFYHARRLVL